MSTKVNRTAIGIFVVGGVALIIFGILVLGSGRFLTKRPTYVMFFEGSVNGLRVGASVLFKGVPVGTVSDIGMRVDPKTLAVLIPVYVEIGDAKIQTVDAQRLSLDSTSQQEIISQMIRRGLRARLEMQSVVTGLLQVSLDFYPDTAQKLARAEPRYTEIPTIPTPLQMLAERVERIPLEEILERVNLAVDGIQKLVNSPQMQGMAGAMLEAADDAKGLIGRIDRQIDPMAKSLGASASRMEQLAGAIEREVTPLSSSLRNTLDQAGFMLHKAGATFGQMQEIASEDSGIFHRFNKALEELELSARSLRTLSDTIEQNPQILIFGKQRPERRR